MKKIILKNFLPPGDIVMLTAAVRDLHKCYPGQFLTDVRTLYDHLWENNPYITPLQENNHDVEIIECHYPLINNSNNIPFHFVCGFTDFLNGRLDLKITPTRFKGDIYLSLTEKAQTSQVQDICNEDMPFWIVVAGGKSDFTIKWWEADRFQEVIDYFHGKILFVQIGDAGHHHPPLKNVVDLRGKTDLRQLIRLVYHSKGVLSPVTLAMHLAAAIEFKGNAAQNRPCVVVAGGREPPQWAAYPSHQFIHTVGALPCCAAGGCWKSRTIPLGDGDEKDRPDNLCKNVIGTLPYCMDMITSEMVIQRIEGYFNGSISKYLNGNQAQKINKMMASSTRHSTDESMALNLSSNFHEENMDLDVLKSTPKFSSKSKSPEEFAAAVELIQGSFVYGREGRDGRKLEFLENGRIGEDVGRSEVYWDVKNVGGKINLYLSSEKQLTCILERHKKHVWIGRWFRLKQMPMRLSFQIKA